MLVRRTPPKRTGIKRKRSSVRTASWYRKQSDILFSRKVRSIGYCEWCGKTENLQCSHVVSRTVMSLRCDSENAICLCYACHMHKWHLEPISSAKWFEGKYPGRYDRLVEKRNVIKKVDWKEVYESLIPMM